MAETESVGPTMSMPNYRSGRRGAASVAGVAFQVLALAVVLMPATASLADGQRACARCPQDAVTLMRLGGETHSVSLGDVNGDGRVDVFVLSTPWSKEGTPRHRLWLNDGNGGFVDSGQDFGAVPGQAALLVDLDEDGDLDLLLAQESGASLVVWENDGSGHFTRSQQLEPIPHIRAILAGDLDRDGDTDVVVSGAYSAVLVNDGWGRLTDTARRFGGGTAPEMALDDIDGDGNLDLVTGGFSGPAANPCPRKVWLNDGTGNFRDRACPEAERGKRPGGGI